MPVVPGARGVKVALSTEHAPVSYVRWTFSTATPPASEHGAVARSMQSCVDELIARSIPHNLVLTGTQVRIPCTRQTTRCYDVRGQDGVRTVCRHVRCWNFHGVLSSCPMPPLTPQHAPTESRSRVADTPSQWHRPRQAALLTTAVSLASHVHGCTGCLCVPVCTRCPPHRHAGLFVCTVRARVQHGDANDAASEWSPLRSVLRPMPRAVRAARCASCPVCRVRLGASPHRLYCFGVAD